MKKENLISKWLDLSLDADELSAFEKLDADGSYRKISETAKLFKSPEFNEIEGYKNLTQKLSDKKENNISWKRYITSIAAVLLVALGVYFSFFNTNNINHVAENAQHLNITLPDASSVVLNAHSRLSYDEKNWDKSRNLQLDGEAYFKVEKGSTFKVSTPQGTVSVLGTQFNIKSRAHYFEVSCYEGLVQVVYENETIRLPKGNSFRVINSEKSNEETSLEVPEWTQNKSLFKSVPLSQVLDELERQYNIQINSDSIDKSIIFTGSFTHGNIDTALKAITIPLGITYKIQEDFVTLKKDL